MTIQIGESLPDVATFVARPDGPMATTTGALFNIGRSVLFGVPGAFTPTCSARHLPGYVERADQLFAKGIERIVCMATNDAFVMAAWAKAVGIGDTVLMMADGNATFVKALGLEADQSERAMGIRAQRFAMVIADGVVSHLYVDPPGGFNVSGADHILAQL